MMICSVEAECNEIATTQPNKQASAFACRIHLILDEHSKSTAAHGGKGGREGVAWMRRDREGAYLAIAEQSPFEEESFHRKRLPYARCLWRETLMFSIYLILMRNMVSLK